MPGPVRRKDPARSARIFSAILKAFCEALLDIVFRALDQSIDSIVRRLVNVRARLIYHARKLCVLKIAKTSLVKI